MVVSKFVHKYWRYLLLTTLVVVVYFNSLDNQFVSDDLADILNNPQIQSFEFISSHLSGAIRPILYVLTANLLGINPTAFRLINLAFHLGSVFLVFRLFQRFFQTRAVLPASMLFAVHPLLSEPVVWISGGAHQQYSFFVLLTFLAYLGQRRWLSWIAFALAVQSHHVLAVAMVPILVSYELLLGSISKNWTRILPFILISVVSIGITLTNLPGRMADLQTLHYQDSGIDNPLIQLPAAISSYLILFTWPQNLTIYQSELGFSITEFALRTLLTLGFLSAIIYTFFRHKQICFWLLWFLIALSPTLTPFRLNWIVAERYAYLPSIGLFALVALAIQWLYRHQRYKEALVVGLAVLILALSTRTIIRNQDWQDADTLWLAAEKTSPSSPNNHNNLGDLYGRRGEYELAIKHFQTAIELKPNYADAYHNLGNTLAEVGKTEEALASYQKALEFNPILWQSYQNIAAIYFEKKEYKLALEYMQKAAQLVPNNQEVLRNLEIVRQGAR